MEFRCTVSALVSSSKNYRRVIGDKNLWILKANLQPKPQSRSEVDFCRHSPLTGGGSFSQYACNILHKNNLCRSKKSQSPPCQGTWPSAVQSV